MKKYQFRTVSRRQCKRVLPARTLVRITCSVHAFDVLDNPAAESGVAVYTLRAVMQAGPSKQIANVPEIEGYLNPALSSQFAFMSFIAKYKWVRQDRKLRMAIAPFRSPTALVGTS